MSTRPFLSVFSYRRLFSTPLLNGFLCLDRWKRHKSFPLSESSSYGRSRQLRMTSVTKEPSQPSTSASHATQLATQVPCTASRRRTGHFSNNRYSSDLASSTLQGNCIETAPYPPSPLFPRLPSSLARPSTAGKQSPGVLVFAD